MNLTLYYAPTACAMVPYIALTEAGADFKVHLVNLLKGDNTTPEFLRINPKKSVPVLMIDGSPLTENVAIQIWIARNWPEARLLPRGPLEESRAIAFLAWCASGIHPRLTPIFLPQRFCDMPGSEQGVRRCAEKLLLNNYAVAEDALADGRDWFFGDFTTADAYFFWCFRRGIQFKVDVSRFARCYSHFERMKQRPSVEKLLAFEKSVIRVFTETCQK